MRWMLSTAHCRWVTSNFSSFGEFPFGGANLGACASPSRWSTMSSCSSVSKRKGSVIKRSRHPAVPLRAFGEAAVFPAPPPIWPLFLKTTVYLSIRLSSRRSSLASRRPKMTSVRASVQSAIPRDLFSFLPLNKLNNAVKLFRMSAILFGVAFKTHLLVCTVGFVSSCWNLVCKTP